MDKKVVITDPAQINRLFERNIARRGPILTLGERQRGRVTVRCLARSYGI